MNLYKTPKQIEAYDMLPYQPEGLEMRSFHS